MVPWLFECYKLTNKLSGDVNYSLHCQYAKPKAPEKKKKTKQKTKNVPLQGTKVGRIKSENWNDTDTVYQCCENMSHELLSESCSSSHL